MNGSAETGGGLDESARRERIELIDFEDDALNELTIPDASSLGFEVNDYRVQLRGICQSCRAKEKKEESK